MSTSGREVKEALKTLHDFNQIQAFVFDEAHLVEQEADCRDGDSYYRGYTLIICNTTCYSVTRCAIPERMKSSRH